MKETLFFYYLSDLPTDAGAKVGVRPGLLPGAKVAFPSWVYHLQPKFQRRLVRLVTTLLVSQLYY